MSETNMSTSECVDNTPLEDESILRLTENGIEGFEILCRLCANRSDHLIPIYSEEGISNDLSNKMNLYLPVKVSEADTLPLQCCYQCASTVLTWHELVIASVEADRRLRDLQLEAEKHIQAQNATNSELEQAERESDSEDDRPVSMRAACLNPVRQEEDVIETTSQPYPKKRRRLIKGKQQKTNDGEFTNVIINPSSDGEWIKTEIILDEQIPDPFEAECKIREGTAIKLDIVESESNDDDFNAIDPEFDPGDYSQTKIHSCSNCSKTFRKLTELRKHSRSCEHNDQMVKTESSDEQIMDENQLDDDFEIELIDDKKETKVKREYRCDYCPVRAVRKENLKKHMKAEHPDKVDCFVEKRRRRSKIDQDAVNRAKVVVDSRTYYHCDECGKNLHSPYTYIWHNRIHTGERPFVCDLCGKQFRVSQGLVRHLRETHAGIKNFPCDLCGRMFATRRNVEEHRRIHTNERPYICDLCGKAFKQKASLFVHNRSHNDSFPFKCSYCNQGFRTRPPLLVHVTRHTGEKPHACDICGRCFRIKYELKRHRLIHSDDKPFSCTDCGLSFRQKRYLRNHNKINHNRLTP